jgi:3-phosphoshikimate 1-carboxyvinyltransferase
MDYRISPSKLSGTIRIPGSKSHTIRALVCALFADGESIIRFPLISSDTLSGKRMVEQLGATVIDEGDVWRVRGGHIQVPEGTIDVGNSGTSLYFGIAAGALAGSTVTFDGDDQIRRRTARSLLDALSSLGVTIESNDGCAPLSVTGPIKGGHCTVYAKTSQYLSALLLAAPRAKGDTTINVPLLNERPYVDMTLQWLDRCGIEYHHDGMSHFRIRGNQQYKPFDITIPADFSSAAFFLAGGAIAGGPLVLEGLDYNDVQGDKRVADILRSMGARVDIEPERITVQGPLQQGGEFDLNEIPDSLPILSLCGSFAPGRTVLHNVAHARIKETDRIAVMCRNITLLGGNVIERDDGLFIEYAPLTGGTVDGHADHRVIMSAAIAGAASKNGVYVNGADAVSVTFPEFGSLFRQCGGKIEEVQ